MIQKTFGFDSVITNPPYLQIQNLKELKKLLKEEEKIPITSLKEFKPDFTNQLLLGMESYGYTSEFIAKERFDGLLFIKYSDIPKLIKKK